ncbi:MAG: hypothetical protein KCHDKBKB_01342 [Elusimicrobia bacterium]|nr:hypothetical protein [Elusimicrobiota bacterium]
MLDRIISQLLGRADGPMYLRLIIQPLVAIVLALRAGIRDAKANKTPYLEDILKNPEKRPDLLHAGWKDFNTVFFSALGVDLVYQIFILHRFYPLQAVLVAVVLSILPYFLVRGPVTRLAKKWISLNQKKSVL